MYSEQISTIEEILEISPFAFKIEEVEEKHGILFENAYLILDDSELIYLDLEDLKEHHGLEHMQSIFEHFSMDKGELYYIFSVNYKPPYIEFESSEIGFEDLMLDYANVKFKTILDEQNHKKNITHIKDAYSSAIQPFLRLGFNLTYIKSYDYWNGGYEWDLDVNYLGIVNETLITPNKHLLIIKNEKGIDIYPIRSTLDKYTLKTSLLEQILNNGVAYIENIELKSKDFEIENLSEMFINNESVSIK